MSSIQAIIDKYKRVHDEFVITLPLGDEFKFRQFQGADDWERYVEGGQALRKKLIDKKGLHASWKEVIPERDVTILKAHLIAYLSIEPKISDLDALTLAKANEGVFIGLYEEIESYRAQFVGEKLEQDLEAAKKD